MAVAFDEKTRALLDGKSFATIATLNPDGGPQTSVVWITREDDTLVFSSTATGERCATLLAIPGSA